METVEDDLFYSIRYFLKSQVKHLYSGTLHVLLFLQTYGVFLPSAACIFIRFLNFLTLFIPVRTNKLNSVVSVKDLGYFPT